MFQTGSLQELRYVTLALILSLLCVPTLKAQDAPGPIRVLVVDETRTLFASFQVNALVQTLRGMTNLSVAAQFVEVDSGIDMPPLKNVDGKRFDVVVIVPRELDQFGQIWLITRPWNELTPSVQTAVGTIADTIEAIFGKTGVHPVNVNQDLVPGWFAAIFQRLGLI